MHFRFLQFPRGSQDWSLSDSELERSIPDLALVIQPIPLSEAGNENAYVGECFPRHRIAGVFSQPGLSKKKITRSKLTVAKNYFRFCLITFH